MEGDKVEQVKKEGQNQQKRYIKSDKKWKDFKLHADIIAALKDQNKLKPTAIQAETLEITTDEDRKKYNLLIRAVNGAGKTMAFLLPILNSLEPGLKTAEDKVFRGKMVPNQVFKPQGVILLQNNVLQEQIEGILKLFQEYGQKEKCQKLQFKLGVLNKEGHVHGDIIICQAKSFLNRHQRGNMNLDNCKFVAVDQVDDVYQHDKDSLAQVLKIIKDSPRPNLITCSATMDKHFLTFYKQNAGDYITNTRQAQDDSKERVTLTGVHNYYYQVDGEAEMHKYVIKTIFKALYEDSKGSKPQIFIFFNSIDEIHKFTQYFDSIASDFTSEESQYLKDLSKGVVAAKLYKDNQKVDATISDKNEVMKKFRANEISILLATNIIARGIDIRNAVLAINVGVPRRNQKQDNVDVDTYLHRVGRTGRHNDKGVALTVTESSSRDALLNGMLKVHGLKIEPLKDPKVLAKEVMQCIANNAKS